MCDVLITFVFLLYLDTLQHFRLLPFYEGALKPHRGRLTLL